MGVTRRRIPQPERAAEFAMCKWAWVLSLGVWSVPVALRLAWPRAFHGNALVEDVWGVYLLPAVALTYCAGTRGLLWVSAANLVGGAWVLWVGSGAGRLHALVMLGLVEITALVVALVSEGLRSNRELLIQRNRELYELSRRDVLTGLLNRRGCLDYLAGELARAKQEGDNLALLFCDIDPSKR